MRFSPVRTVNMKNNKNIDKKKNIFIQHLQFILILYLAGIFLSYFIYMVSPKYYKSSVSIIRPSGYNLEEKDSSPQAEPAGMEDNEELFVSILKSRRMKEDIVRRFDLVNAYKVKSLQDAAGILEKRTTIDCRKEGIMEIVFMDNSSERAAEIANYYTENLNAIIRDMGVNNVSSVEQKWIEGRLSEVKDRIAVLDKKVSDLQRKHNIVVDKDLSQLSRLTGRLSEELYLKTMEMQNSESSKKEIPDKSDLGKEIEQIKKTLAVLASLKAELVNINREISLQETLYASFSARIEEVRRKGAADIPFVQVLDTAGIPEKINKPDLKLMLIINTAVCGIIALIILFFDLLKHLGSI